MPPPPRNLRYSYTPLRGFWGAGQPDVDDCPDNGQTTIAYNDTTNTVTTSKKINPSQTITAVAIADGVGHVKETQLTSDPQGTIYTDTTYDGRGRVRTVSNPYRSGSDPTTTLGTTTYFYDALGRKCLEVPPDGTLPTGSVCSSTQPANDLFTTYYGNTTTVTDLARQAAVSIDMLKNGGGAIGRAKDLIQAASSDRNPPAPNGFAAAGLAIKAAIKIYQTYFK